MTMKTGSCRSAVIALVLIGCQFDAPDAQPGESAATATVDRACPLGPSSWIRALGPATVSLTGSVAVDAFGNVLVATTGASATTGSGVTQVSPDGNVLYTRPFGSMVAADQAGNAYVAGAFSQPINLGTGKIVPGISTDVFVAKLDPAGTTLFARGLGIPGNGLASLAVDPAGRRIAVSGPGLGTVVLDATGKPAFSVDYSGAVAFDAASNLVIVGTFTTSIDLGDGPVVVSPSSGSWAFVVKLDGGGHRVWSRVLTGRGVAGTAVAFDAQGDLVVAGFYSGTVMLFGDTFRAVVAPNLGRVSGAFVAKLDRSGEVIWKIGRATGVEANGVAIDAGGNVVVNGASASNNGLRRIEALTRLDARGTLTLDAEMFPASGYGRGVGVATDACGSIYASIAALDSPSPGSPIRSYLAKITP